MAHVQSDTDAAVRHIEDRVDGLVAAVAERNKHEDMAAAALASLMEVHSKAIEILDVESRQHSRKLNELEARMNQLLMGLAIRGMA